MKSGRRANYTLRTPQRKYDNSDAIAPPSVMPGATEDTTYASTLATPTAHSGAHATLDEESDDDEDRTPSEGASPDDAESQDRRFVCPQEGCQKTFSSGWTLRRHQMSHSGARPFACSVPGCDRRFNAKDDLRRHRTVHTDARPFVCAEPSCGKTFKYKKTLRVHARTAHSGLGKKPFACPHCEKRFSSKSGLKEHTTRHSVRDSSASYDENESAPHPARLGTRNAKRTTKSRTTPSVAANETAAGSLLPHEFKRDDPTQRAPPLLDPGYEMAMKGNDAQATTFPSGLAHPGDFGGWAAHADHAGGVAYDAHALGPATAARGVWVVPAPTPTPQIPGHATFGRRGVAVGEQPTAAYMPHVTGAWAQYDAVRDPALQQAGNESFMRARQMPAHGYAYDDIATQSALPRVAGGPWVQDAELHDHAPPGTDLTVLLDDAYNRAMRELGYDASSHAAFPHGTPGSNRSL